MRIQANLLGNLSDLKNVSRVLEYVARALNGQVSYGDTMANPSMPGQQNSDVNLKIWKFFGTSPGVANTAFTLSHSLVDANNQPHVPMVIVGQITNNGGLIYGDVTTWTTTSVTLKCTTASAAYRVIIA